MRDNSTLAKLLAEEDISVVHKKVETAAFDVKRRELILPQWKEMPKMIQDLMTCHEVGHALWTSLEMLEEARDRKIEKSFVNVIEDVRIESMIQKRYAGSRKVFRLGYAELIAKNFFKTQGMDLQKLGLIDRINLHFKKTPDIHFSPEENDWVNRVASCKTEADVLNTAEELYKWMQENPESQEQADKMMEDSFEESDVREEYEISDNMEADENSDESEEKTEVTEGAEGESDETKEETEASSDDEESDEESEDEQKSTDIAGGNQGSNKKITATTDDAYSESTKEFLDEDAKETAYYRIPKLDIDKVIVSHKEINSELQSHWSEYYSAPEFDDMKTTISDALAKLRQDSKKTISYMVKEFEMKKAADQYARAATSKTGRLDLNKVHTYKYNDDLFAKVTTMPGATSHGMVIFIDWSGSMWTNMFGTIKQLFNLMWFCQRVQIPFEVYAFSSQYSREPYGENQIFQTPKIGDLIIKEFHLLNFFSSNMSTSEFNQMLNNMFTLVYDWRQNGRYVHYNAIKSPRCYDLGGTPLDSAIVAAMDILPKFKSDTGVQKVNTIFLTDGDSHPIENFYELSERDDEVHHGYIRWQDDIVITDPVTNKKVKVKATKAYNSSTWNSYLTTRTACYLQLLKYRVPSMNIVGFFIAGSGKNGTVPKKTIIDKFATGAQPAPGHAGYSWSGQRDRNANIVTKVRKELKKNNVAVCKSAGYDEYYILPSLDIDLSDKGIEVTVGASKSQLKSAFKKNATSKTLNRPLLNKFIGMVA